MKGENIGVTLFSPRGTETAFGSGWKPEVAAAAFSEWLRRGPTFDGTMAAESVGEAIANCFELPPTVACDFVEIRPNKPQSRKTYVDTLYAARRDNP